MYVDEHHHEHHKRAHKQHKQGPGMHSTENSITEQLTDQKTAADQHRKETDEQPTLHRTWNLNLGIRDLTCSGFGISTHRNFHQDPKPLLKSTERHQEMEWKVTQSLV